jgi:hypothetical protein
MIVMQAESAVKPKNDAFAGVKVRIPPTVLFLCSTGLLILAAWFEPDASGVGTHTQLDLPACGFKTMTKLPCPTCGCTTSFALAADGRVIDSMINQPFGATMAVLAAVVSLVSAYAMTMGIPITPFGRFMTQPRFILSFAGLLIAAWVYKIYLVTGAQ